MDEEAPQEPQPTEEPRPKRIRGVLLRLSREELQERGLRIP